MRIDSFTSAYPTERGSRQNGVPVPSRQAQREEETPREASVTPASTQVYEPVERSRRVPPGDAPSDSLPARPQDLTSQQGISRRAAQAIASYGTTASFAAEANAPEVLGLDLYA